MRTNHVLIDYENVQPKSLAELQHDHFNVIVLVGANQTKLDFEVSQALLTLAPRAQLVKISGNGKNALDFHIAYYIGHISASDPHAFFHIISGDSGFDPLIQHLKTKKIYCARSKDIGDMPIVRTSRSKTPAEKAVLVANRLQASGTTRPRTTKTLLSTINSWFQKELSETDQQLILAALIKQGTLAVDNNKVTYHFNAQHS